VLLALPLLSASPAAAATDGVSPASDVRELTRQDFELDGEPVKVPASYRPEKNRPKSAAETPPLGTVRQWLGLDEVKGVFYRKDYTLRGVGAHIEVWVAHDLAFPAGDCRTRVANTTMVTDAQVAGLVTRFDTNMYPKETAAFSTPPDRDGTDAVVKPDADGNGGVYTGGGDKTVTLVDNVRDANYHTFPAAPTYLGGFFSPQLNELLDRNVLTIDAFDWAHRTGTDPPDEPAADPCTSRPAAPNLYEATYAHEWQHLAHYYTDPLETTWMNEGLSGLAETLTGYADPGTDSRVTCFQGFGTARPRGCGGPENSLNLWDEGADGLPADYGNADSLMLFLYDRYGTAFVSALHRDGELHGLAALQAALKERGVKDVYQVLHDFQTMTLVDRAIDRKKGVALGVPKKRVTTPSLDSAVNPAGRAAYGSAGAAPNGADYVSLRAADGRLLRGQDLRTLTFAGARTLPPAPLAWTVVSDDPDRAGNPVLWSGDASDLDAAAVARVGVPVAGPALRFLAKYGTRAGGGVGSGYGYVVVSTDGGRTYTAIPGDRTVAGPLGPGVTGATTGFEPHTYDLSGYSGRQILLGFRYVGGGGGGGGGWRIDDVTVGGATVSDGSLTPFDSPGEISPTPVAWNVRLIGLDEKHAVALQAEFAGRTDFSLKASQLAPFLAFPSVVAVVAYDEPTEQVRQYAAYTLGVNGVTQPGGGP
jgi:hypothetical protein